MRFSLERWASWIEGLAQIVTVIAALAGSYKWAVASATVGFVAWCVVKKVSGRRRFSDRQRMKLIALLAQSSPDHAVTLVRQGADSDAAQYATEIQAILRDAGWRVTPPRRGDITPEPGIPDVGLSLAVKDPDRIPAHGVALRQAFATVGIDMTVEADWRTDENGVSLQVSNKPL